MRIMLGAMLCGAALFGQDVTFFYQQTPAGADAAKLKKLEAARQGFEQKTLEVQFNNGTFAFVTGQMVKGGIVKGSPYSAEAVTESTQVLADGNRIVNRTSTKQFRDSEGREWRERSAGKEGQEIVISDPVEGASYTLRTDGISGEHRGEKTPMAKLITVDKSAINLSTDAVVTSNFAAGGGGFVVRSSGPNLEREIEVKLKEAGAREELGAKVIEGVMATGTRTKKIIAAGEIGNEKPIEIVSETWYSPDLQMTVYSKNSDPRSGETVFKLINISRSEPPRTLFDVPVDYTINYRENLKKEPRK